MVNGRDGDFFFAVKTLLIQDVKNGRHIAIMLVAIIQSAGVGGQVAQLTLLISYHQYTHHLTKSGSSFLESKIVVQFYRNFLL